METPERLQSTAVLRLLAFVCPDRLYEEIEGDLIQQFNQDEKIFGTKKARRRFLWNSIKFCRPGIVLRNKVKLSIVRFYMIRNYIKIAFRNFSKQKSYTLLNVVGLAIGMAASLLIFQYVKYERSFDSFHTRARDIYRMQYNGYRSGKLNFESAVAVPAAARALKDNFPEVEEFTRFLPVGGVIAYENSAGQSISFYEQKMQFADPAVFKVFDFVLTKGNPATALEGVDKAVISERAARKYFGNEDPIGKQIKHNTRGHYEITGVFRDVPENSHIQFDFLLSYATLNRQTENSSETAWGWYDFYTFFLLRPNTDVTQLQAKWDEFLIKTRKAEWDRTDEKEEFILRPLSDIHLYSHLLYEAQPAQQRDGDSVYALSIIAIFILVIAWVNYINLATARSFNRANEVGVRKVMGAFRSQLIGQFLTESFILNLVAALLAILTVRLLWSPFSSLSGWKIPLEFMLAPDFWKLLGILLITGAIVSGFYPAIILSSFKPVSVLKGKVMRTSGGNVLRKSLVIFQFVASVFLISGSIIVYQQIQYMKVQDLGFTIDETLVLKGPGIRDSLYNKKIEGFKNEVLQIPGLKSLTATTNIPGDEIFWTTSIRRLSGSHRSGLTESHVGIDYDYVPSFGIKVIAGRSFDKDFPGDENRVVINRAMAEAFEFKDPASALGEKVNDGGDTLEIIGVLENYHQMSLKNKVAPIVFRLTKSTSFYALKVESDNYKEVIASLETPWKTFFPGNPIDYFFLDQFFNKQYEKDDRFGQVFTLFTTLAIFIASLGLFGLASFMAMQRTKEIGIRKVMGSTVSGIVLLLSRSFMQPVVLANLVAWPLAWWVMNQWLQSFPYRITISPFIFLLAGGTVTLIAFVSVSSQTFRAALTKPAETLKYE